MLALIGTIIGWITSTPLDRALSTVDTKIVEETKREAVKAEVLQSYLSAQAAVLTGRGWWFPLFFVAPLGFWFAAVCVYSVFWCAGCAYPQTWSVAALPPPLDQWAGGIVGSLFLAKGAEAAIARLRK